MTIALSETLIEKAERYLVTGKVTIHHADVAWIKGDSGEWVVARTPGGNWICSCPAYDLCSHLVAVSYVTGNWSEAHCICWPHKTEPGVYAVNPGCRAEKHGDFS